MQGLKQVPGTRFPLLMLLAIITTLHSHSHTFSLTSKCHRVVASANDAENIARRREFSFALPGDALGWTTSANALSTYHWMEA
jgi:hypothetical protein